MRHPPPFTHTWQLLSPHRSMVSVPALLLPALLPMAHSEQTSLVLAAGRVPPLERMPARGVLVARG